MEDTIVPFLTNKKFCIKYVSDIDSLRNMIETSCGSLVDDVEECDHIIVPLVYDVRRTVNPKEVSLFDI